MKTASIGLLVLISLGCGQNRSQTAPAQADTPIPSATAESKRATDTGDHTLEVIATGTVALVEDTAGWTAVMPSWPAKKVGEHGHEIPAHHPFLLVPVQEPSFFPADSRQPDEVFTPAKGIFKGRKCALFYLDKDWLRFVDLRPHEPLTDRAEGIVSMDAVCAQAKTAPKHDKNPASTAARVEIGRSSLGVKTSTPGQWHFTPQRESPPDAKEARLAQEIVLTFDIDDHFELEPAGSSGWRASTPIRFTGVLTDLKIALGNATDSDIHGTGPTLSHAKIDPHFEIMYKLMDHRGKPHIPFQDRDKSPEGSNCPPGTLP